MTKFKPTHPAELNELQRIARTLKDCNAQLAAAKKYVEAAKEGLTKWLKEKRQCDVETLKIGDMVQIEGVLLLEVSAMNKFDEGAFTLAEPKLHEKWKRDFPVRKFRPLV